MGMQKIKGVEEVELAIGRWSPSDLVAIESFELVNHQEDVESELLIRALFQRRAESWPNFEEPMFRVLIVFKNVTNLSLKDFGGGSVQIMGFDIKFIGDRGIEGVKFEIEDYEDNRIEFNCGGIEVWSVKLAG